MKPVDQMYLHDPDNGVSGDCFRACVASVLELPIEEVPHFVSTDDWIACTQQWLKEKGLQFIEVQYNSMMFDHFKLYGLYHMMTGPSPRFPGSLHCCVALDGKIVHDPHPDRSGLAGSEDDWLVGLLIKY